MMKGGREERRGVSSSSSSLAVCAFSEEENKIKKDFCTGGVFLSSCRLQQSQSIHQQKEKSI